MSGLYKGRGGGRIYFGSDFAGNVVDASQLGPNLHSFGVGTEVYNASTVDETGGILSVATGGSDDDNFVLRAGVFSPRDGKMKVYSRFKYSNVGCAIFFGFAETLDTTTPVMPAEFATATMTYNPGGMVGFQYDSDGTTDDFRAVMGYGSAAISDSSNGTRVNATLTADRWFESEVVLNEDGSAELWFGDSGHANSTNENKFRLIKRFTSGTLLTTTDLFFAVLMIENRSGATRTLEVDCFEGEAGRDWRF